MADYLQKVTLPPEFIEMREGRKVLLARQGWEEVVRKVMGESQGAEGQRSRGAEGRGLLRTLSPPPPRTVGGRGGTYLVPLTNGERGVVRRYLRGGLVRRFVQELYWGLLSRPLTELVFTEEIRRRGVPTVEVLGACVERMGTFFYRGAILTREATGFINLWEWLSSGPQGPKRQETIGQVARTVKQMHDAGVDHRDLNLTNILVRWTEEGAEVRLIDFDRARLYARPLSQRRRERNLARLRRSLQKLDPTGKVSSDEDVALFCCGYRQGDQRAT